MIGMYPGDERLAKSLGITKYFQLARWQGNGVRIISGMSRTVWDLIKTIILKSFKLSCEYAYPLA